MKLENYGYREETIKVRTMTMAELMIGIAQELSKKNCRCTNIRLVCLTDGTVDEFESTEEFLMRDFNYAWEIELLSVKEILAYNEDKKCSEIRNIVVIRDAEWR